MKIPTLKDIHYVKENLNKFIPWFIFCIIWIIILAYLAMKR